jgi:hypothetical protein
MWGNIHDGKGGAPLTGGVAPGWAGEERLWVGWPVRTELIDVNGRAVGFVECSDARVVLKHVVRARIVVGVILDEHCDVG